MKESASGWFLLRKFITMHGPYNVKSVLISSSHQRLGVAGGLKRCG